MSKRNGKETSCSNCMKIVYVRPCEKKDHNFCSPKCSSEWRVKQRQERFWKYVKKTKTCWLWTGMVLLNGRPYYSIRPKQVLAYRYAWFIETGKMPTPKQEFHHECKNKTCVRFDRKHVYLVKRQHNPDSPSHVNRLKTHCIRGHKLPTKHDSKGRRICLECRKLNYAFLPPTAGTSAT